MSQPVSFDLVDCRLEGVSLIEASAGTGKTWNICGLYLRLLLERELDVRQILVVTFTNAATAELHERIRRRLAEMRDFLKYGELASGEKLLPRLAEAIERRQGFGREAMIRRLELALQTFDEAAIFTIHGFCQRVLSDTPFAAGRAFTHEMLPDDNELLKEVVHDFWRRHVAGNATAAELAAYLCLQQDSPEKFFTLLKHHLAKPLARNLWPTAPASADAYATLITAFTQAKNTWQVEREQITRCLTAALPDLRANSYNPTSLSSAFQECEHLFASDNPLIIDWEGRIKLLCTSILEARTRNNHVTPRHLFFDQMQALQKCHDAALSELENARLVLIRRMLEECTVSIRQRKRELRVISFDDMLASVMDSLREGPDSRLAQALRERYPVAMVDEFQDTDPLQHTIFSTIYGRNLAPLFLLGDPKQAIYSFRNADLHAYLKAKRGASAVYSINDNQRAAGPLLNAVNALFSANARAFMLDGLEYHPSALGQKPRMDFADRIASRAPMQVWWLPENEGAPITKNEARRLAARATASEIARLLRDASAGQTTVGDRPLHASDIAVLVRTHAQGRAIRHALARLGIASVELSQASVFHTQDADDVERILTALLYPSRQSWLFAALASETIGLSAQELDALKFDDARQLEYSQRFASYREAWRQHGIGYAIRQLFVGENVLAQMLRRSDGERRMTNLFHLAELLHQAERTHPSPDALLRWFQSQRQERSDDSSQLRLESDQNLVRIMTIHKAKGLEFPIVFCPYLWEVSARSKRHGDGIEYHDESGETVIDYRPGMNKDPRIDALRQQEAMAEDMRLIYVALTRAMHRCYLIAGCYSKGKQNITESARSPLNWLIAGNGIDTRDWQQHTLSFADITAAWQALAVRADGTMAMSAFPPADDRPFLIAEETPDLACQPLPASIPAGWRTGSFSSLVRGAIHENAAIEHDTRTGTPSTILPATPLPADDILLFPRGAHAGDCLHKALEICDFTNPASWHRATGHALAMHPQHGYDNESLNAMMVNMISDVVKTSLPCGISLEQVAPEKRLNELEFTLPSSLVTADRLCKGLQELGYAIPRLSFRHLEGYLKGFIDLVFEHDGRYYLLDWKSNHLGFSPSDYGADNVAAAMAENGYHLQYLLYAVALDRYLGKRLPGYRPDRHFGGVFYLFVRGVRPSWRSPDGSQYGVFFHRPENETLQWLGALFNPVPTEER